MAQTVSTKEDLFFGKQEGVFTHNRKGLRPEEFIQKFITKKSTNNWTDEEALKHIVANLREEGHDWYSTNLKERLKGDEFSEAHTAWCGFLARFRSDFCPITSVHDLTGHEFMALRQKQNESAMEFVSRTMRETDNHATLLKQDWELPTVVATDIPIDKNVTKFQTAFRTLLANVKAEDREEAKNATDIITRMGAEFALGKYVSHNITKVLINGLTDGRLRRFVKEFARTEPSMQELFNFIRLKVAMLDNTKDTPAQKVHVVGQDSSQQQEEEQEESNTAAFKPNKRGKRGKGRRNGRGRGGAKRTPLPHNYDPRNNAEGAFPPDKESGEKPQYPKSKEECGYCFIEGHNEEKCDRKKAAQDIFRKKKANSANGPRPKAVSECGYCLIKGHKEERCYRKKAAQDILRKTKANPTEGAKPTAVSAAVSAAVQDNRQNKQKERTERPRYQEQVGKPRSENFGQEMHRRNGKMNHSLSEN